jgi:hypothetical protein
MILTIIIIIIIVYNSGKQDTGYQLIVNLLLLISVGSQKYRPICEFCEVTSGRDLTDGTLMLCPCGE